MLLSKKEKEKLVIELAQQGKTSREIAKLVHMSLKNIGEIIRKFTGDEKDSESIRTEKKKKKKRLASKSKYAQAFYLFREKKRLCDVAIELDLDADTVLHYHNDYLRLNDKYKLVNLYHKLGHDLPLCLHLFERVKKEGLTREGITDMLQTHHNTADMKETLIWLNSHVPERMKEKREYHEQEIVRLDKLRNSMEDRAY